MEYLSPHVILRRALIEGRELPRIADDLALFVARTLFRGSDLSMDTRERKADLALFADNVALLKAGLGPYFHPLERAMRAFDLVTALSVVDAARPLWDGAAPPPTSAGREA